MDIAFPIIALFTVIASAMAVFVKKTVHSALYLAGSLIGVAALFILLNSEFLAVIQVLVYVGAIITLMLFTIMLTRKGEE